MEMGSTEMSYADYVKGISFRICKPNMSPRGYGRLASLLGTSPAHLEILNTRLPEDARGMRDRLADLCQIPRMSSYAIAAMINKAVSLMSGESCFLNVGVWNGFTFLAGLVGNSEKSCIGVDNFSEYGGPREEFLERFNKYKCVNHHFHDMDYVEYFEKVHKEEIGFYIYDGNHGYRDQLRGLQVAEPFFSDKCVVLVDDTNWDAPKQATLDFISGSSHNYEIILDKSTSRDGHPTLWNGLMVFQRVTA